MGDNKFLLNKLKSLKVAQSKDDDGGVMVVSDVVGVMCMMVWVMVCVVVKLVVR